MSNYSNTTRIDREIENLEEINSKLMGIPQVSEGLKIQFEELLYKLDETDSYEKKAYLISRCARLIISNLSVIKSLEGY